MKRKSPELKVDDISEISGPESEVEKVSFYAWFGSKLQENPRLLAWQREQLLVFMKSHGLSENEEKDKYDNAYKCF